MAKIDTKKLRPKKRKDFTKNENLVDVFIAKKSGENYTSRWSISPSSAGRGCEGVGVGIVTSLDVRRRQSKGFHMKYKGW